MIGPDGDSVGSFVTNGDGRIEIPLSKVGNYTVIERESASHYVISEEPHRMSPWSTMKWPR